MDNRILIIILLMITRDENTGKSDKFNTLENFINNIELDSDYTTEKIKIAKKIGPYFPEDYIPLINKSIYLTEKLIKTKELINFIQENNQDYITDHVPIDNNKDRVNKIVSIIKKESPNPEVTKIGTIVDLVLNIDKYKKMFNLMYSAVGNQDSLNNPAQLINLITPLIGGDNPENISKFKDIAKMLDLVNALDNPSKDSTKTKTKNE